MRGYLKDITSHSDNNVFDDIKLDVCNRVQSAMFDLSRILNFALEEGNLGAFDDFLSCAKVDEIEYQLSQRKYLYECDRLKDKL